ncbi:MAG: DUF885 family protein [Proteobacteria bacterium]|nr:DUF885 family protein [Pseudomonadota bacterium]
MFQTRRDLMLALAAVAATPAVADAKPAPHRKGKTAAKGDAFARLCDDIAADLMHALPETATLMGLDQGRFAETKRRLNDRSAAERVRFTTVSGTYLKRLKAIDRSHIKGVRLAVYDTLAYWLQENTAQARFPSWDQMSGQISPYVLSQITGSYQSVPDFMDSDHTIKSRADVEAYVARMHDFAKCLDQETARFRRDVGAGVIPPAYLLEKTIKQVTELRDTPAAKTTLVASLKRRALEIHMRGDPSPGAIAIVEREIVPALDRQIAALKAALPKAGHEPSVYRIPNGEAFYAEALRQNITTTLTPAEIHKMGEDIAQRLVAELDTSLKAQGLTQGSVGERLHALYEDPKYRYPNTDAGKEKLLAALHEQVDRIRAKLPAAFRTLPKSEMVIRRVPSYLEGGAPGAYAWPPGVGGSRPGAYYINLRDTAEVPTWTLPTLTHHEGIPGHYLQGALENESKELPLVQQILGVDYNLPSFNAYLEGWALYAEQVADELGMYETDPMGRIGYLHDALFRAGRLVADTGLHAMGWSREKGSQYFQTLMGDPATSATGEIDRYTVWPGQACSYMVGKVTWLRLREKAKAALGPRFDIRDFHDVCLLAGAMPLETLEQVVDRWIVARKA